MTRQNKTQLKCTLNSEKAKRFWFYKARLRREIGIAITFKLIIILLLWAICFSHPVKNQLTTQKIQQQLLGTPTIIKEKINA